MAARKPKQKAQETAAQETPDQSVAETAEEQTAATSTPTDATPAPVVDEPALPAKVTLEQNFTFWHRPHHNAEITMQFYAGQVVSDAQLIALLIANNAPLKD